MKIQKSVRRMFIAAFILMAVCASPGFALPSWAESNLVQDFIGKFSASIWGESSRQPLSGQFLVNSPAISTNRANYLPGETIVITGANWTPGEIVTIDLWKSATMETTADENGQFSVTVVMPDNDQPTSNFVKKGQVVVKGKAVRKGKILEKENAIKEEETVLIITAKGNASGSSTQVEIRRRNGADEEEGDADLPSFMIGKIDKEDYLRARDEYINRRRGIEPGQLFDREARSRAVELLDRQSGLEEKKSRIIKIDDGSTNNLFSNSTNTWMQIGPSPIPNGQTFNYSTAVSGRITAIAIHPTNPDIIYVGAAQGGVYRSTDGGSNWTPLFDAAQTLAIGSIAIAPSQPSTIYVGTGEGNNSCDSYFGVGVYRIDNADSSAPTLNGPFNQETGTGNDVMTGRAIPKIIVHPSDPNTIFVGTGSGIGGIGCDQLPVLPSRGLYRSTNAASANATFQKLSVFTANGGNRSVSDIEFEPDNPNNLLATVTGFNTAGDGGVYRTTNALAPNPVFTQTLSAGTASVSARVELAINKVGNVVTVYAATSDSSGTVKRSTDGGVTWSAALASATGYCGGQCTYDMPIAVDPNDANVVYIGGNADGTNSAIMKKSTNALTTATFVKAQDGLHADSHVIEIAPTNSSLVFTGNDGGIWRSIDAGANWVSRNTNGLITTQFQSIALHPTDSNFTIGGTQDNGTNRINADGSWSRTDFGDGGFALIDQNAVNTTTVRQYHTYFNQTNNIIGFGTTTNGSAFENWTFLGCGGTSNGISCSDSVEFYAPMALGPGTPNTVYFGTSKLYRSTNSGTTMTAVSQTLTTTITAIGISPQSDNVRIIGTRAGTVFRTTTGASPLTNVTGTIPARYIARAVIDPNNVNTAYVTLAGYFGNSTAHIYKTTNLSDAAPTWTPLGSGTIPDVPVNAFVVDPANSNMLYAGTDVGVYRSIDGGATWSAFSDGLPRVAVFDMAIQNSSRILRVATHGRGLWEISVAATPGILQGTITDAVTNNAIAGAIVNAGSNAVTTNGSGFYQITGITAGTYNLTISAAGYNNGAVSNVTVNTGQTTVQNAALTSADANACLTDTLQTDFQGGVVNNADTSLSPGDVQLAGSPSLTDQQMTSLAFFVDSINTTNWQAQTFTAGVTGKLTAIDLQLAIASAGTPGTLVFEIRNTVSGVPGATVLASTTSNDVVSTGNAWYNLKFASPLPVTSGTSYALVIRASSGGNFRGVRSNGNTYANGAWFSSTNSGGSWTTQTTDLAFRTYVSAGFVTSGNFVSSVKDSNPSSSYVPRWGTISWTAVTPANTTLSFQAAASNSPVGPFIFVGPDGTPGTFFTNGGSLSQFDGYRYLKYRAVFTSTNTSVTPVVNDVTVCFNNTPLDSTPPVITPTVTGTLGNNGWYTSDVQVSWTVVDNESTISSQTGCDIQNVTADTAGVTFTCQATSLGGMSSQSVTIKRDATAPTINFSSRTAPNANGWNNSNVAVQWNCSDATSGATSPSISTIVSTEGSNQSTNGICTDNAGNTASNTQSGINIDKTAPSLNPSVSPNPVLLNASATAAANAADALSGIASQSCGAVVTSSVGFKSVLCTATDLAGNSNSANANYQVVYNFGGFFSPVQNLPLMNTIAAGSIVDIYFSLGSNQGLNVIAPGYPVSSPIPCNATLPGATLEPTQGWGRNAFTYNSLNNRYHYQWYTNFTWAGTCRMFVLRLTDGSEHYAKFQFQ